MLARMPTRAHDAHARLDLPVVREEVDDTSLLQGHEILLQVACAIALVWVGRILPLG
jgi:hypothetical protein